MREQLRNIIKRQKERGLSGVISNLSKASNIQADDQRRFKEEMDMQKGSSLMNLSAMAGK